MPGKKSLDKALEKADDRQSETFLRAFEEDGEIIGGERLRVRQGTDRRPVRRTETNEDPCS